MKWLRYKTREADKQAEPEIWKTKPNMGAWFTHPLIPSREGTVLIL